MAKTHSIKYSLYSVFVFFLLLVFALGIFSIDRLRQFNAVSADIRDRWLPNTRYLGDLSNHTSDFPAAEASRFAATTSEEIAANGREVKELDRQIALTESGYERVYHDTTETARYLRFKSDWTSYRATADRVFASAAAGQNSEAARYYMTVSKPAYDRASDELDSMTEQNVASARNANQLANAAYGQAVWLTGLAVVFATVMVAASVFYIRRSISDPLLKLARCMRLVAANATDVDIVGTERRDEVGEMARAVVVFRNNAIDLAVSQRGLAQQAAMLREKLEQEQHLGELQRNFVSMASHEFRTPLTVIDGHAQRLIAAKSRLQPHEIAERAAKIRGAVLRMTNLIGGLLGSSLMEGKVELYFHPARFDLAELLRDVCRTHREISPRSQILERITGPPLFIVGDRNLLAQVFSNLLSNAIKYSPDGAAIELSTIADAGTVAVTVEDHGMGIPQSDLERLFERYYRGSNVAGIVGTGIGLHFVKMVIELHGGTISVQSNVGRGSVFTVQLPSLLGGIERDAASKSSSASGVAHDNSPIGLVLRDA